MCNSPDKSPATPTTPLVTPLAVFVECGSKNTSRHTLFITPLIAWSVADITRMLSTLDKLLYSPHARARVYHPGNTLYSKQIDPVSSAGYAVYHITGVEHTG